MRNYFIFSFLLLIISANVWSQDQSLTDKNPRVIEMEMMLTKEASAFIQQRIPNEQFYVNINVTPLRRVQATKNEQLPYFYSEDDIGDEWDALDTPIFLLLSRIKTASIKVEIPQHLSDLEISDLKEKLYEQLKLIPGRDNISIERKILSISKPNLANENLIYYFITALVMISFIGLYFSLKFTTKNTNNSTMPATNAAPSVAPNLPSMRLSSQSQKMSSTVTTNSKINGDISFKDSMKAADMLKEKINGILSSPIFPLLSDILILEELSEKSLSSFGAFLLEMPIKQQQQVFFRGRSDKWFRGYLEASSVDIDCFLAAEKMLRGRNNELNEQWEELLIQVWRLSDDAHIFLKQIPTDDAFKILAFLPKSFSVPTAKKAYPGAWAKVLDSKNSTIITDKDKLDHYLNSALELKPHFSFKSIDEYRQDLELVDYLRSANIKDEEEIYESLNSNSSIFNIRPAFYTIFKAEAEDFKIVHDKFKMEEWALVLLNSPREYMKKVTNELDDKRRYLFSTILKQLDESQPNLKEQSDLREEIARFYKTHMSNKKLNKTEDIKGIDSHENEQTKAA
jgi:hypothetical protein